MPSRRSSLLAIVLASALLGCVAAVGVVEVFDLGGEGGGDGSATTVVQQAPLSGSRESAGDDGAGLTARDIYKRDADGVVFIRADVVQRSESPFDFEMPQEERGQATGSGFVIDKDGTILTNAHVVEGARQVTVQFGGAKPIEAKVVGRDPSTDLAVLKIDPQGLKLSPLALGSSKGVQVGDPTVAIGNPFGLERTLTTGVISATKRTIQAPDGFQISDVIQTDAAINPGNSGGPLIDAAGRVIGVNSQIQTGGSGGGNVGIGFAVPIDTAKRIVPQLKREGRVDRGFLGIESVTIDERLAGLDLPTDEGALVQTVTPGSPADKAGIRAGDITAQLEGTPIQLGGDIIVAIDGRKVRTNEDVSAAVTTRKRGDKIKIELLRDGERKTVTVTLGERPAQAPAEP